MRNTSNLKHTATVLIVIYLVKKTAFENDEIRHKDCDDKDIFEGDILGDWNDCDGNMVLSNEVVFFDETLGCWMLDQSLHKDHSFATSLFENLNDFAYKVIGNIYEHPDLVVVASEADA